MADGNLIVREVRAKISAEDDSAAGIASFEDRISKMKTEVEKPADFMKGLNENFGRNSELGHITHILEGGGALLALGIASRLAKDIGDNVKKFSEDLATGNMRASELPERLVQSIPIIGGIYDGMKGIGEVMTGVAQDSARWGVELKNVEESYSTLKETIKSTDDFLKARGERMNPDSNRERDEANKAANEQLAANAKKFQAQRDKILGERDTARAALQSAEGAKHIEDYVGVVSSNRNEETRPFRDQIQRADTALADLNKLEAEEQKKINDQRASDVAAAEKKIADEKLSLRTAAERTMGDEMRKIQSESDISELNRQKKALETQAEGLEASDKNRLDLLSQAAIKEEAIEEANAKEQLEREKATIQQRLDDRIKNGVDVSAAQLAANKEVAAATIKSMNQEADARDAADRKKIDLKRQYDEAQQSLATEMRKYQIQELENSGSLSAQEKSRLDIAERFVETKERLLKIANDQNADPDQRPQARDAIGRLPAEEQAAMKQYLNTPDRLRVDVRGGDAGFLTGVAEQARTNAGEQFAKEQASQSKETAANTAKMIGLLEKILNKNEINFQIV